MARSIVGVVIAVVAAMFVAAGFERVAGVAAPLADGVRPTAVYQLLIAVGWAASAFVAAAIALFVGRRWAPIGGLASASIGLLAVQGLAAGGLAWWMWPLSLAGVAAGGYGAVRVLKAPSDPNVALRPKREGGSSLFK
ncbi:MAG: hypothetical protein AAGC56_11240 [Pseudomonadota bacterium]